MSVLWLIIKVSLLILLLIFLCLVFILIVLLLAPVNYDCLYGKYEKVYSYFKINLLHIIEGHYILEDERQESKIKILGLIVYHYHTNHFTEHAEENIHAAAHEIREISEEVAEEKTQKKIKNQSFIKKFDVIKDIVLDERFQKFVKEILIVLKRTLKFIKPYKINFTLIIGRENPADTGELMAQMILLYPWYYKYGVVKGRFDEEGIWGKVYAKGRFNLITLITIIILFIIKKETREYIRILLKIRKGHSNEPKT